jgi:ABC-type lipoprotein release transport system permease subunit
MVALSVIGIAIGVIGMIAVGAIATGITTATEIAANS